MYGSTTGSKRHKMSTSYLARPKLGSLKGLYTSKLPGSHGAEKRKKVKKPTIPKMDFRKKPDSADTAYREAVARLRFILTESYVPVKRFYPSRPLELDSAGDETDNQSLLSVTSRPSRLMTTGLSYYPQRKYGYSPRSQLTKTYNVVPTEHERNVQETTPSKYDAGPPELMSFIEKQEEYIEQLERESRFCRDELSALLGKVKDVISENENLHERQKSTLLKSVFDHLETETETETEIEVSVAKSPRKKQHRTLEGPAIVFESRISELEAQLTQMRIDLKKAQDENDALRRKIAEGGIDGSSFDLMKKQIEGLQGEKNTLQDTVTKLQTTLNQLRTKENDTTDKVKRTLDAVEQAQYEKSSAELEVRRLKDELERQHGRLRDAIAEQNRKVVEERNAVERRYSQQIEQLTNELGVQWETNSKLQLELDKQRREAADLRRELTQKQAHIDELRKEMQKKMAEMQADVGVCNAEKSALEHQLASQQMANERNERQHKQEVSRLQAEMQSLRQRSDRADADLIHSRRENIRLGEQVASLEKEINMNRALTEERNKRPEAVPLALPMPSRKDEESEVPTMLKDMEAKHAATVAELEGMIQSQNQLMDKLSGECQALTKKLEDASNRHKEEIRELQSNLDYLSSRFSQSQFNPTSDRDNGHNTASNEADATHYSNNTLTAENQPLTNEEYLQQQQEYDPNQEQYINQPEYYDQSQYDASQYDQNYENQYEQYGVDPNAGYAEGHQQYENYEQEPEKEEPKVEEAKEEQKEEVETKQEQDA